MASKMISVLLVLICLPLVACKEQVQTGQLQIVQDFKLNNATRTGKDVTFLKGESYPIIFKHRTNGLGGVLDLEVELGKAHNYGAILMALENVQLDKIFAKYQFPVVESASNNMDFEFNLAEDMIVKGKLLTTQTTGKVETVVEDCKIETIEDGKPVDLRGTQKVKFKLEESIQKLEFGLYDSAGELYATYESDADEIASTKFSARNVISQGPCLP